MKILRNYLLISSTAFAKATPLKNWAATNGNAIFITSLIVSKFFRKNFSIGTTPSPQSTLPINFLAKYGGNADFLLKDFVHCLNPFRRLLSVVYHFYKLLIMKRLRKLKKARKIFRTAFYVRLFSIGCKNQRIFYGV